MRIFGWIVDLLAAAAAIASAYGAVVVLRVLVTTGLPLLSQGAGFAGAVSLGLWEGLLALVVIVVANRLLARPARRSGGLMRRLLRAHSIILIAAAGLLLLLVLALVVSIVPLPLVLATSFCIGVLVAVQFALLSVWLVVFIRGRRPSIANPQ